MANNKKLSSNDRARQFLPFDALKGLKEALRIKEYEHERLKEKDISEEKAKNISDALMNIEKNTIVMATYFNDGYYIDIKGKAKLFIESNIIQIDDIKINLDQLFDLKIIK